jgi:amino acid adenylation domain-containing protein
MSGEADRTRAVVTDAPSLGDAFERLAQLHGPSVAVADDAHELTYAELDERASAVRDTLLQRGTRPGARVGICLDRSVEAVVAILGILKAGAAYVPLDPAYPAERLRFIAQDAGITTVVGEQSAVTRLDLGDVQLVSTHDTPSAAPPGRPILTRDDPAYVIYTSGSTGQPKGVIVTHDNVLELMRGTLELFGFTAEDRWSVFHSFNFDVSVWELWRAFVDGGCAVIVGDDVVRSPTAFAKFLSEKRITILNQIPSVFRYVVLAWEHEGRPALSVRSIVFAGEAIDLATVARFAEATADARPEFINMYGITEITVHATFKRLTEQDWSTPAGSPIGRALPHLEIAVLDEHGQPVAPGELGEMWVGGSGVAAGYLNRPDLTRERFRTLDRDGEARRFYRSGDLARLREDGELDFAGRNDQQVKVRGFRIEPGEIEAALRRHPAVRDVAVVAVSGALTAVVSPQDSAGEDLPAALRRYCEERLPGHMVPGRVKLVDEMPLTPSGKLDRRAVTESLTRAPVAAR